MYSSVLTIHFEEHEGRVRHALNVDSAHIFASILGEHLNDGQCADPVLEAYLVVWRRLDLNLIAEPLHLLWEWVGRDGTL